MPTLAPESLMTPEEVAALLKVDVGTLRNWRSDRIGPVFLRLGPDGRSGRIRYERAEVLTWLSAARAATAAHWRAS